MIDPDIEIFTALRNYIATCERAWLCTVIDTYGSSPRPRGSMLALSPNGDICGSLSGGCVEDDLIEKLLTGAAEFASPPVQTVYGGDAEEAERFSLPCGGQLHVLVEHLPAAGMTDVEHVISELESRKVLRRQVNLNNGNWRVEPLGQHSPLSMNNKELIHSLGPQHQLVLVGAGALAESIALFAPALGYQIVVCDPRPERLAAMKQHNIECIQGMPDDVIRELKVDAHSSVLAVSHDPRIDDMALMEALNSSAAYVGALGSVRTAAKRRERLLQLGLVEDSINRLHAPVGLDIGAKTPAEIALAILAELTQLRRK